MRKIAAPPFPFFFSYYFVFWFGGLIYQPHSHAHPTLYMYMHSRVSRVSASTPCFRSTSRGSPRR